MSLVGLKQCEDEKCKGNRADVSQTIELSFFKFSMLGHVYGEHKM